MFAAATALQGLLTAGIVRHTLPTGPVQKRSQHLAPVAQG